MAYNLTALINDTETPTNLISQINIASNGFFVGGLLVLIFLILFITLKIFETKIAFTTSSIIVMFLTILSWWAGWLAWPFIFLPSVMLFAGILWFVLGE